MKPVCISCQRFYRMEKSGYYFLEGMPKETPAAPGTLEPEKWQPYKIWAGDLWRCEGCGTRIICGTGQHPIAEHYQPTFADHVKRLGADQLQVNDC